MTDILIVEDNKELAELLREFHLFLQEAGRYRRVFQYSRLHLVSGRLVCRLFLFLH